MQEAAIAIGIALVLAITLGLWAPKGDKPTT